MSNKNVKKNDTVGIKSPEELQIVWHKPDDLKPWEGADSLNEMVVVNVGGEKVEMTKKEAFIQQLLNESMKGKSAATKNLIYLLKNLPWIDPM